MTAVLAVCGFSGSGKTTLLEALIPRLKSRGLAVAVIKHDAHRIQIDTPGKDSDRLFKAGADVALRSSDESAWRWHPSLTTSLERTIELLEACHDLILVEGHKQTPIPKLWLAGADGEPPPDEVVEILAVAPWDSDRVGQAEELALTCVATAWRQRRLFGGLLIGGASRRMGRNKAALEVEGVALAERVLAAIAPQVEKVVLLGAGEVPPSLLHLDRLPDAPGVQGPSAGLLAALRWAPHNAWLIAACDLALVTEQATRWLVEQRRPGAWAVMPDVGRGVEPLLAVYEPQARWPLEDLVARGITGPRHLAEVIPLAQPTPPTELLGAWTNVNTPDDLEQLEQS